MTAELERQLAELRPGDHVGQIYAAAGERAAVASTFLKQGLSRGERCIYVADNPILEQVAAALAATGVDVPHERARGALVFEGKRDAYLRRDTFVPEEMLAFLAQRARQATDDGFAATRVAGDMTWACGPEPGCDRLIEYEAKLADLMTAHQLTVLCQYDRRLFAPAILRDVLRTHSMVVLGDQVCPNLYYEPPALILSGASDAVRVDWMIRQLRMAEEKDQALQQLAADNAQLFQEEQRRRGQLEAVRTVAARMTRELDLTALLRGIVREAAVLVGDAAATLFLLEDASMALRARTGHDAQRNGGDRARAPVLKLGEGVVGRVAETRRGAIVNDYRTSALAIPSVLERTNVAAVLATPIAYQDRLIGVLGLWRGEGEQPFADDDLATVGLFADEAALAIENARLYQALAEREQELHELVRQLLMAQEEERRRLAYDVHDGLAQLAAATNRHLQAFSHFYHPRSSQAREDLQRALDLAQQTVREARQLVAGLRPAVLDDLGLVAAVRMEAEALGRDGWKVTFDESLGASRLPISVETTLFRIAQEALANVRKHTSPGPVRVTLSRPDHRVRLAIRDWGRGFDPAASAEDARAHEKVGLASMQERVNLLGGRWTLRSRRGAGTSIVVEVPERTRKQLEGGRDGTSTDRPQPDTSRPPDHR